MSKSPIHSFLVQWLHDALLQCLPAGLLLRTEQPLSVADSEPEPDLAVVRGRREDFREEHPTSAELVIEVSMTSHEYDRSKLTVYAEASVKEVWLVLAPEKKIEVHRLPVGDHFTKKEVHGSGGRLVSTALPEFSVELDGLFAR